MCAPQPQGLPSDQRHSLPPAVQPFPCRPALTRRRRRPRDGCAVSACFAMDESDSITPADWAAMQAFIQTAIGQLTPQPSPNGGLPQQQRVRGAQVRDQRRARRLASGAAFARHSTCSLFTSCFASAAPCTVLLVPPMPGVFPRTSTPLTWSATRLELRFQCATSICGPALQTSDYGAASSQVRSGGPERSRQHSAPADQPGVGPSPAAGSCSPGAPSLGFIILLTDGNANLCALHCSPSLPTDHVVSAHVSACMLPPCFMGRKTIHGSRASPHPQHLKAPPSKQRCLDKSRPQGLTAGFVSICMNSAPASTGRSTPTPPRRLRTQRPARRRPGTGW